MTRTDRQELEILRVSIARVAQALGVESDSKPVKDKSFNELSEMAKTDRGWNLLCAEMVIFLGENITVPIHDGETIIESLRLLASNQPNGNRGFADYAAKLADTIRSDIDRRK